MLKQLRYRGIGTTVARQEEQIKNIWMLSREYGNLAGAGGVKDVVCQLAETLARWTGRSLHVVLPLVWFYGCSNPRLSTAPGSSLSGPAVTFVNRHASA